MRFRQPLDTLLNSKAKIRLLRFLCRKGGEWNGRRIASQLAMSPVTAHKALRELNRDTILDFHKVGRNFVYSLRDNHHLVQELLRPLFDREARVQDRLSELFRRTLNTKQRKQILTAAIYGSVAKGQERPTSDLDFFVLVRSERAKREIHRALDRFCEIVMSEFGNTPALYVNTAAEGQRKLKRQLPLFQNIIKDHKVIWGRPLEEILRGQAA